MHAQAKRDQDHVEAKAEAVAVSRNNNNLEEESLHSSSGSGKSDVQQMAALSTGKGSAFIKSGFDDDEEDDEEDEEEVEDNEDEENNKDGISLALVKAKRKSSKSGKEGNESYSNSNSSVKSVSSRSSRSSSRDSLVSAIEKDSDAGVGDGLSSLERAEALINSIGVPDAGALRDASVRRLSAGTGLLNANVSDHINVISQISQGNVIEGQGLLSSPSYKQQQQQKALNVALKSSLSSEGQDQDQDQGKSKSKSQSQDSAGTGKAKGEDKNVSFANNCNDQDNRSEDNNGNEGDRDEDKDKDAAAASEAEAALAGTNTSSPSKGHLGHPFAKNLSNKVHHHNYTYGSPDEHSVLSNQSSVFSLDPPPPPALVPDQINWGQNKAHNINPGLVSPLTPFSRSRGLKGVEQEQEQEQQIEIQARSEGEIDGERGTETGMGMIDMELMMEAEAEVSNNNEKQFLPVSNAAMRRSGSTPSNVSSAAAVHEVRDTDDGKLLIGSLDQEKIVGAGNGLSDGIIIIDQAASPASPASLVGSVVSATVDPLKIGSPTRRSIAQEFDDFETLEKSFVESEVKEEKIDEIVIEKSESDGSSMDNTPPSSTNTNTKTRAPSLVMASEGWEKKIKSLYAEHEPSKVVDVHLLLSRHKGKESELVANLTHRYIAKDMAAKEQKELRKIEKEKEEAARKKALRKMQELQQKRENEALAIKDKEKELLRHKAEEEKELKELKEKRRLSADPSKIQQVEQIQQILDTPRTRAAARAMDKEANKAQADKEVDAKARRRRSTLGILNKEQVEDDKKFEFEVIQIYTKYAPQKLGDIPNLLKKFKGREDFLLQQLEHKYMKSSSSASESKHQSDESKNSKNSDESPLPHIVESSGEGSGESSNEGNGEGEEHGDGASVNQNQDQNQDQDQNQNQNQNQDQDPNKDDRDYQINQGEYEVLEKIISNATPFKNTGEDDGEDDGDGDIVDKLGFERTEHTEEDLLETERTLQERRYHRIQLQQNQKNATEGDEDKDEDNDIYKNRNKDKDKDSLSKGKRGGETDLEITNEDLQATAEALLARRLSSHGSSPNTQNKPLNAHNAALNTLDLEIDKDKISRPSSRARLNSADIRDTEESMQQQQLLLQLKKQPIKAPPLGPPPSKDKDARDRDKVAEKEEFDKEMAETERLLSNRNTSRRMSQTQSKVNTSNNNTNRTGEGASASAAVSENNSRAPSRAITPVPSSSDLQTMLQDAEKMAQQARDSQENKNKMLRRQSNNNITNTSTSTSTAPPRRKNSVNVSAISPGSGSVSGIGSIGGITPVVGHVGRGKNAVEQRIYKSFNERAPDRVNEVPALLAKYKGREAVILQNMDKILAPKRPPPRKSVVVSGGVRIKDSSSPSPSPSQASSVAPDGGAISGAVGGGGILLDRDSSPSSSSVSVVSGMSSVGIGVRGTSKGSKGRVPTAPPKAVSAMSAAKRGPPTVPPPSPFPGKRSSSNSNSKSESTNGKAKAGPPSSPPPPQKEKEKDGRGRGRGRGIPDSWKSTPSIQPQTDTNTNTNTNTNTGSPEVYDAIAAGAAAAANAANDDDEVHLHSRSSSNSRTANSSVVQVNQDKGNHSEGDEQEGEGEIDPDDDGHEKALNRAWEKHHRRMQAHSKLEGLENVRKAGRPQGAPPLRPEEMEFDGEHLTEEEKKKRSLAARSELLVHKGPKGVDVDYHDPRANFKRKEDGEIGMRWGMENENEAEEEYDSAESLEEEEEEE